MGLFGGIFGSKEAKEQKVLPWIALREPEEIKDIIAKSKSKPQLIFKHSTRCGISRMVLNQFVDLYTLGENDVDLHYLDLLNYRAVSDEVGYTFQVTHQSPQLLVIKNGSVVAHASHGAINDIDLARFI